MQVRKGIWLSLLLVLILSACNRGRQAPVLTRQPIDLTQMRDSGRLVVVTMYSSTSYFMYRGQEMGFQYELSKNLAEKLGLPLEVQTAGSVEQMINMLEKEEVDLIAYPINITKKRKDSLTFCGKNYITHQVLIQNPKSRGSVIENVTQLIGKTVYALPGKYTSRLKSLNQELGGGINIVEVKGDTLSEEDLITKVAKHEIEFTVADDDIAKINKTYYPKLNISLKVGLDQRAAWVVRKTSPILADSINIWSRESKLKKVYQAGMKRYFELSKEAYLYSPILDIKKGVISVYDPLFKKYAEEIGWDWRLLASLAYQESNFHPDVVSWAGAKGLMQLMPRTAHLMGVPKGKEGDPEESIKGAINYIEYTNRYFKDIALDERQNFILASYNSGIGHINDARALAKKFGKNPDVWYSNVENFILLKSRPQYYNDSVCKHGYFRGRETYNFVREITSRYNMYKKKVIFDGSK